MVTVHKTLTNHVNLAIFQRKEDFNFFNSYVRKSLLHDGHLEKIHYVTQVAEIHLPFYSTCWSYKGSIRKKLADVHVTDTSRIPRNIKKAWQISNSNMQQQGM